MQIVGNNFDECLNCDNFVAWNIENAIDRLLIFLNLDTMRSRVPQQSMYLREATRRRICHESEPSLSKKYYNIDDTIGISKFTRLTEQIQIQICYCARFLKSKLLMIQISFYIRFSLRIVFQNVIIQKIDVQYVQYIQQRQECETD